MFGKKPKVENPSTEKFFEAAIDWESSHIHGLEKSENRAWFVAKSCGALLGLSLVAIAIMMPLKESVPYVIRVDKATGATDIVTVLTEKKVSADEVMNKYWVSQFMHARETYDWYTLQKEYDAVGLFASKTVAEDYAKLFEGENALDKKYGNGVRVTVDILSIVPDDNFTATVRFTKTIKRTEPGAAPGVQSTWVATLAYKYNGAALIGETTRLTNPLGFQVLTYRVDPEMVGSAQ